MTRVYHGTLLLEEHVAGSFLVLIMADLPKHHER